MNQLIEQLSDVGDYALQSKTNLNECDEKSREVNNVVVKRKHDQYRF